MRYTIEGFSQTEAVKFRRIEIVKDSKGNDKEKVVTLDCTDLVILRWFVDFWPNMMKVEIGGRQYAWLSYKAAIEDMPILGVKKGMFALRLKKLVDFGILNHKTVKSGGTFSYYGFGPQYARLVDSKQAQDVEEPTQNISDPLPKKLETLAQNFSDQIDPNTKDSSTKDNPKREEVPFAEIIAYLNEKTGRSYRNVESNRKHIRARWNEYPDLTAEQRMEMFRHCIDAMCSVWLGDGKMGMYLRPQTLFGSKFEGYANQPIMPKKPSNSQRQMDLSEYSEPRIGSMKTDNRTGKTEVYRGNGVWEEYISDYVPQEGDVDIEF